MRNRLAEQILFLKVKNKDKEAFGKFYDLYISRIYRFIFFKVSSVSDAQDLTSEVFLKLWQYIRDDKKIENLNALIYRIARNSVIDFYRQKSRRDDREELIEENHLPQIIDEANDLADKQAISSEVKVMLKGLENLKEEYKEVIVLRYLDELSITEISDVLNKSKGSVRVLIHRALNVLKQSVENEPKINTTN